MKKYINGPSLLCSLVAFILFVVAACGAYYLTAATFVTPQIAVLYTVLGLVGALALLFHLRWFAVLFYVGCGLGWCSGRFVGGLKGDFAPTAGLICTSFLIAVFILAGVFLEWKSFQRRHKREQDRRQRQQKADEEREAQLLAKQAAKAEAQKASASPLTALDTEKTQSPSEPQLK